MKKILSIPMACLGLCLSACLFEQKQDDSGPAWKQRYSKVLDNQIGGVWLNSVKSNGNLIVAVGTRGMILTSEDGVSWAQRNPGPSENPFSDIHASLSLHSVVWTGQEWIAVGSSSSSGVVAMVSSDGITWSRHALGYSGGLYSVTWTGNMAVAVGTTKGDSRRLVVTSADGMSWTVRDTSEGSLNSVVWTGTELMATGGIIGPQVRVSTDGVNWVSRTLEGKHGLTSIVWAKGRYYGLMSDSLLSSSDGVNWSRKPLPHLEYASSIAVTDNGLLVLGSKAVNDVEFDAMVITSSDGEHWSRYGRISEVGLHAVVSHGNRLVGVGRDYVAHFQGAYAIYTLP